MAGMWGSFEDIKKAIGIVVILLIISFGMGYCVGKGDSDKPVKSRFDSDPDPDKPVKGRLGSNKNSP